MSNRRSVVATVVAAASVALALSGARVEAQLARGGAPKLSIAYGTVFQYNASYPPQTVLGDGWASTWSNDDKIYTMGNDTSRWNDAATTSNMKLSTLSSSDPSVVGTLVNDMTAWGVPMTDNTGTPPRSHKGIGLISVGGVLYSLAWRLDPNWITSGSPVVDGQLIKSIDHGLNWTPVPPATAGPYASPMFPGVDIPLGFVQYGKDYAGSGPDNSSNYVYALVFIQSTGFNNLNPSFIKLARVPIAAIGNLVAADWQYWTGGDGMNSANWGSSVTAGAPMLTATNAAGNATGMQYLPRYGKYLYIADTYISISNRTWSNWLCDHPWGPCTRIGPPISWIPSGLYYPSVIPKSLVNGGQTLVAVGSGDNSTLAPGGPYTLYLIPVTVTP